MLSLKLRLLKRLDRMVGPWVIRWLKPTAKALATAPGNPAAAWQPQPIDPDGIKRILLIRPGGIGDAVLTFPMIKALKEHFTGATIDVLGERRNTGVYQINNLVSAMYRYDHRPLRTLSQLRHARYQIVIDTEQYHHLSVVVANALRPEYLCGFDTVGRGQFQTHRVRYCEPIYEIYSFLRLAAALTGREPSFDRDSPFLDVDERWQEWAARTLAPHGDRPLAVIVPGASTPHKYWAPDRYADIARWLIEHDHFVVILGGRDTLQSAKLIAACNDGKDALNLAGRTALPQTTGIVQRASLYISSDTGALHIAYGVGTPTVHMFGSGIQEKWAPQGRRYVVVNKGLPCSPCTRYGYTPPCPYGVACMEAIEVEDVIAAIEEVLRQ
ncbi:MAG: glycosyltransferase family 9 protein [Phycisphaerales bacterium]|nr:MAG: glycosyltransferase family 9 protein [Phycisphaerales bacterium]